MKLYHELAEYYASIEETARSIETDVEFITGIMGDAEQPKLLDLGCGTGEHIAMLADKGFVCTGIDLSTDMIRIGRARFGSKITLIAKDMKDISYNNEFDCVISMFGSMNYLLTDEDVDAVFWNMWRALKDNASALLDIDSSSPLKKIKKKEISQVSATPYKSLMITRDRGFSLVSDENNKTLAEVNYNYTIKRGSQEHIIEDKHIMRSFTLDELKPFVRSNGFTLTAVYADSSRRPFTETSSRMLMVLKKR